MVNDCFENNQNMRAGLKPAPTDGFPNNYAFYSQRPQGIAPTGLSIMHVYNETHDRASLRDFAHTIRRATTRDRPYRHRTSHMKGRRPFIACDGSRFHNG
jgi:hypothetical protein